MKVQGNEKRPLLHSTPDMAVYVVALFPQSKRQALPLRRAKLFKEIAC